MAKKKTTAKDIMVIKNKSKFLNELTAEMQEEYQQKAKDKIKNLMKQIAMTEALLVKQQKELDDYMSGKKQLMSKDEYLFQ